MVGAAGWVGGLVGAVAAGASRLPGTIPAPAGGVGGPPWAPGTGSVLAWGSVLACGSLVCGATGGAAVGATAVGVAGGVAILAVGWIVALGGIGALPCWIRAARCATACGTAGPAGLARPATAGARLPGADPGPAPGAGAGGRLITVLITVVLWMFW